MQDARTPSLTEPNNRGRVKKPGKRGKKNTTTMVLGGGGGGGEGVVMGCEPNLVQGWGCKGK